MIDLLIFVVIASFWCIGVFHSTLDNFILEKPDKWLMKVLPSFVYRPLFGCIYCMASLHSLIVWSLLSIAGVDTIPFYVLIIAIPMVSALNGMISRLIPDSQ